MWRRSSASRSRRKLRWCGCSSCLRWSTSAPRSTTSSASRKSGSGSVVLARILGLGVVGVMVVIGGARARVRHQSEHAADRLRCVVGAALLRIFAGMACACAGGVVCCWAPRAARAKFTTWRNVFCSHWKNISIMIMIIRYLMWWILILITLLTTIINIIRNN